MSRYNFLCTAVLSFYRGNNASMILFSVLASHHKTKKKETKNFDHQVSLKPRKVGFANGGGLSHYNCVHKLNMTL